MTMATSTFKIPTFYRIAFLILDPLIAGQGVYWDIFNPAEIINAFVPPSIAPFNPAYLFLQHQLAGALLMCIILDVFLLRKTHELWIWDPVQTGQLLWDVIMVVSQVFSIKEQGRLNLEEMRLEDWGSLGITSGIGLVRAAFLLRVGMKGYVKGRKAA